MKAKAKTVLQPLKISCTSTACDKGLHCFLQKKKLKAASISGKCRDCGADLVDWKRVHKRALADAPYTFNALKYELIRHHFWHIDIDQKAINHARRKGKIGMREAAEERIRHSVGPAEPTFDGRQTPREGNALFYAQHATATCCRKCIEEWHGILRGVQLEEAVIKYFLELLVLYVEDRLSFLSTDGEVIPRN